MRKLTEHPTLLEMEKQREEKDRIYADVAARTAKYHLLTDDEKQELLQWYAAQGISFPRQYTGFDHSREAGTKVSDNEINLMGRRVTWEGRADISLNGNTITLTFK